jgi:L-aminopeptidase/D-esterase-like protein
VHEGSAGPSRPAQT